MAGHVVLIVDAGEEMIARTVLLVGQLQEGNQTCKAKLSGH